MYNLELQKAADKLIREVFEVRPGETVVITGDSLSCMPIINAVASSAYAADAFPMIIIFPAPDGVGKAADGGIPLEPLSAALENCDVWIEFNQMWLLYSTPFERAQQNNKKLRYMCLVELTEDVFVRTLGKIETASLKIFMKKVAEMTRKAKRMTITTPAGTAVSFDTEPMHMVNCDCGEAGQPGTHMMIGQINVVPRFGTVNGTIVFDGTVTPPFGGVPDAPIKLTVENSKIVNIEGGTDAGRFENFLRTFNDDGMLTMAHVAYGFNPGAKLTGNVVEDERVWGATEWGIGYVSKVTAPPLGQPAASHCDGICLNSSVWLDDYLIMSEGTVIAPELSSLYQR